MPNITEEQLKTLLVDQDEFDCVIEDMHDVWACIKRFPAYADDLFTRITSDAATFKKLMTCSQAWSPLVQVIDYLRHLNHLNNKMNPRVPDYIESVIDYFVADLELFQTVLSDSDMDDGHGYQKAFLERFFWYNKALLISVLSNPEKYPRVIAKYSDFLHLMTHFSYCEYLHAFHMKMIANPFEFQRLITKHEDIYILLENLKFLSDLWVLRELLEKVEFTQASEEEQGRFRAFVQGRENAIKSGETFEHYTLSMVTQLISDHQFFSRMIGNIDNLITLIQRLPFHAEALISPVLTNEKVYLKLIRNGYCFHKLIIAFPHHAEQLLEPVFFNQHYFNKVVDGRDSVEALIEVVTVLVVVDYWLKEKHEYDSRPVGLSCLGAQEAVVVAALIADRKAKKCLFPGYLDLLITRLTSPSFRVTSRTAYPVGRIDALMLVVERLEQHDEIKPFILSKLLDPEEFKRFAKTNPRLQKLASLFPEIQILQSGSIDEVAARITAYQNARDNASTVAQGVRDQSTRFDMLGPHLLFRITKEASDDPNADPVVLDAVIKKHLGLGGF